MTSTRVPERRSATNDERADQGEVRTIRLWPLVWSQPFHHDQLVSGMQLLARSLADLVPDTQLSLIVRTGGGQPNQTWLAVRTGSGDAGCSLAQSLVKTLVPWVGFDYSARVERLPSISTDTGATFVLEPQQMAWPAPIGSKLIELLSASTGRWQLTVGVGLTVTGASSEPERRVSYDQSSVDVTGSDAFETLFDVSISLIGTGPEAVLVSQLLTFDLGSSVATAKMVEGASLQGLIRNAQRGIAPPAGLAGPHATARLLSIPLRIDGDWAVVPGRPDVPERVIRLAAEPTPPHLLVVGGSGNGKTTLLHLLAVEAATSGASTAFVVDPHGDLAPRVAQSLDMINEPFDVVDFGAADPPAWNILSVDPGVEPATWATQLAHSIRNLWPDMPAEYFGPVWHRMTRVAFEVLIRDPAGPHGVTDLPEMFARSSALRTEAVARIGDSRLEREVEEEIVRALKDRENGSAALWVVSKIEGLTGDPRIARLLSPARSDFDLSGLMEGRHLLVSLPVGQLGSDGTRLLTSLILERLWNAVRQRNTRRRIDAFFDEFHAAPSMSIPSMLAEGRKFGIRLRLATQNAAQVDSKTWETILANVGPVIAFRTGPHDAARLDALFPTIPSHQLVQLPKYWVAATSDGRDFIAPAPAPLTVETNDDAFLEAHRRTLRTNRQVDEDVGTQLPLSAAALVDSPAH